MDELGPDLALLKSPEPVCRGLLLITSRKYCFLFAVRKIHESENCAVLLVETACLADIYAVAFEVAQQAKLHGELIYASLGTCAPSLSLAFGPPGQPGFAW